MKARVTIPVPIWPRCPVCEPDAVKTGRRISDEALRRPVPSETEHNDS